MNMFCTVMTTFHQSVQSKTCREINNLSLLAGLLHLNSTMNNPNCDTFLTSHFITVSEGHDEQQSARYSFSILQN